MPVSLVSCWDTLEKSSKSNKMNEWNWNPPHKARVWNNSSFVKTFQFRRFTQKLTKISFLINKIKCHPREKLNTQILTQKRWKISWRFSLFGTQTKGFNHLKIEIVAHYVWKLKILEIFREIEKWILVQIDKLLRDKLILV